MSVSKSDFSDIDGGPRAADDEVLPRTSSALGEGKALPLLLLLLFGALLLGPPAASPAAAQVPEAVPPDTASSRAKAVPAWDRRGLLAVHRRDGPVVTATMRGADALAYPLFYGAVPVAWGAALLRDTDYDDAYRLTLSEGLALGLALGLKKAFGRPRPYRVLPSVQSRSARYRRAAEGRFAESFPSGHAAVSFALATSWSLSQPEWYVIGPALTGALLISVSRLWLGVHYPSDVLAGALLGAGVAVGVHLLRGTLTPGMLETGSVENGGPQMEASRAFEVRLLRVRLP